MATQRNNPNYSKSMADQRNNQNPNNSKSMNKKRQPFADISNFNLIPTSTLRKLCSFSSPSTSKPQNAIPKPPISDSNSSKPNYKEANAETSVASSDFNSVQNPNDGRGNEAVLYNLRHTTKKSNLEATALPFTSSHENKKDKRKEIDVPCLSLPPPTVMKDKGKAIAEPFSSLSPETRQEKGKQAVVLSTPVSGNKKKKGIHEPFMTSSPQKVKSKAQAISLEHFPSDEKAAEETFGASTGSRSSLKKTRGKGMVDASVFSCPTLPKKRTNRREFGGVGDIKPSGSWTDPTGKRKKKKKPVVEESLPQDFVNYWREHFKEIDDFELPVEEASYSDLE
ncbi:hypothetical protein EJD97_002350 [Solanum chilense]|uniref:Uncharacterized protein n=1 Tax=Solanum chilense TaxID=4083 RepID=A0A6N2ATT2_SOLCI|nr:hypothetical protein EJD97_002350 [Solanum chilense]